MTLTYTPTQPRRRPAYKPTSRKALAAFNSVTGTIDKEIIQAIWLSMPDGIIDEDIERRTGRKHQTISANRCHLVERGLVRNSGRMGKTRSGRAAIKWVLA